MKRTLKILFYLCLTCLIFFGIGIMILSAFKGNSPEWKEQVEQVASDLSGRKVSIAEMKEARLFPNLMFDGSYIYASVVRPNSEEGDVISESVARDIAITNLQFSVPFWSIFWGDPVVQHLLIEDVRFPGTNDFIIHYGRIEIPKDDIPKLHINGVNKSQNFDMLFGLKKIGSGFTTMSDTPFKAQIDQRIIEGNISVSSEQILIEPLKYIFDNDHLEGSISVLQDGSFQFSLDDQDEPFIEASLPDETSAQEQILYVTDIENEQSRHILFDLCHVFGIDTIAAALYEIERQNYNCGLPPVSVESKTEEEVVSDEPSN